MEQNLAKQTLKTLSLAGYGLGECTSDILIQGSVSESLEPHSIPLKIGIGGHTHVHSMSLRVEPDSNGQVTGFGRLTAKCYCGKVLVNKREIESILNAYFHEKFK